MPKAQFHLEVTNHSAFVRMDAGSSRFYALAFSVGLTILGTYALLFLPGKHGSPNPWHYLHYLLSTVGSGGSLFVLACCSSFRCCSAFRPSCSSQRTGT